MFLLCPNGHRSEVAVDAHAGTAAEQVPCPVCGAAVVPTPAPPLSALVPGYEVLEELGRGGMGVVYKARQVKLDRLVALKVLPPEVAADPAFAERFTREARALARLNHPHIIAIYDFGQEGSLSYFVMEYVAGVNLRDRMRQGPLPPSEVLAIMVQLCDALRYAHEEGIVHRDVKPANVLLDRRGRVKVADFGIAKLLQGQASQYALTGPGQVVGTLRYMAPEQMDNPLALDHRADIYSLGVVFYEMLTGGLPLGRFPRPSEKAAVAPLLDEVVLTALDADPSRRFQDAGQMKSAIEALMSLTADAEIRSRPPPKPDATPVSAPEIVPAEHPPAADGKAAGDRLRLPANMLSVAGILARKGPSQISRLFTTTTGWAVILCLAGVVCSLQPVWPWAELRLAPTEDVLAEEVLARVYGYETASGFGSAGIFLAVLLVLAIAAFPGRAPTWQPILFLVSGASVCLLVSSGVGGSAAITDWRRLPNDYDPWRNAHSGTFTQPAFHKHLTGEFTWQREEPIADEWTAKYRLTSAEGWKGIRLWGTPTEALILAQLRLAVQRESYAPLALGVGLLLLGALQLRGILRQRHETTGLSGPTQPLVVRAPGKTDGW